MKLTDDQRKLVDENAGLAYNVASRYIKSNYGLVTRKGLNLEDLIQAALEQLCISAKTYNPDIAEISTYVFNAMYLKINTFVRTYNQIKIPRWDRWSEYEDKDELIAIGLGYTTSLDQPIGNSDGNDIYYGDLAGEEEVGLGEMELEDLLERTLEDRELQILKMSLQGASQTKISKILGVSQAQVSRILIRAKKKLQKELIA